MVNSSANEIKQSADLLLAGLNGMLKTLTDYADQLKDINTDNMTTEKKEKYTNMLEGFKNLLKSNDPREAQKKVVELTKELHEFKKMYGAI